MVTQLESLRLWTYGEHAQQLLLVSATLFELILCYWAHILNGDVSGSCFLISLCPFALVSAITRGLVRPSSFLQRDSFT